MISFSTFFNQRFKVIENPQIPNSMLIKITLFVTGWFLEDSCFLVADQINACIAGPYKDVKCVM